MNIAVNECYFLKYHPDRRKNNTTKTNDIHKNIHSLLTDHLSLNINNLI